MRTSGLGSYSFIYHRFCHSCLLNTQKESFLNHWCSNLKIPWEKKKTMSLTPYQIYSVDDKHNDLILFFCIELHWISIFFVSAIWTPADTTASRLSRQSLRTAGSDPRSSPRRGPNFIVNIPEHGKLITEQLVSDALLKTSAHTVCISMFPLLLHAKSSPRLPHRRRRRRPRPPDWSGV